MELRRKITVDPKQKFEIGDTIHFKLASGENVQAIAAKQMRDSMLFIHTDCLVKEYSMYEGYTEEEYGDFDHSDLRMHLNNDILTRYPGEIWERMVPFDNGDYLSIPTEKEIFGENEEDSEKEAAKIEQFSIMKQRRNRIAFRGYGRDEWTWYWLKNKRYDSESRFAAASGSGYSDFAFAFDKGGVRPMFLLRNLQITYIST